MNLEPCRICIACWHEDRILAFDDEAHVVWTCLLHASARAEMFNRFAPELRTRIIGMHGSMAGLSEIMASQASTDWITFTSFLVKVRRARRHLRRKFEIMQRSLAANSFEGKTGVWRRMGKQVCRHGVFFEAGPTYTCHCMSNTAIGHDSWQLARHMPKLDPILKCLVVTQFDAASFRRLGLLRAEMKRLDW